MKYIENPKTKNSGIYCCIPQKEQCPLKCVDCFFNGKRSYLNIDEKGNYVEIIQNLPNMPDSDLCKNRVIRVNDGHDSFYLNEIQKIEIGEMYENFFFNTSIPKHFEKYGNNPVVLTVNPGEMTDISFHKLDPIPKNLMFVRFRVNTWNLELAHTCIQYYSRREVPIILTFMAYFQTNERNAQINLAGNEDYIYRKRTMNEYWAITTKAWERIMYELKWKDHNKWVYSCGFEGESGDTHCRFCGNCLREYYATKERLSL